MNQSTKIFHDRLNEHGERIQNIGDIILNLDYWDCECANGYIHRIEQQECKICGVVQEEMPSSRESEIQMYVYNPSQ